MSPAMCRLFLIHGFVAKIRQSLLLLLILTALASSSYAAGCDTLSNAYYFHLEMIRGKKHAPSQIKDSACGSVLQFEKRNRIASNNNCPCLHFDSLMAEMGRENIRRNEVKQLGGVLYGPVKYSALAWYLKYVSDIEACIKINLKKSPPPDSVLFVIYHNKSDDSNLYSKENRQVKKTFEQAKDYLLYLWAEEKFKAMMR